MRLVYFAWVRERIGKESEEVSLPDGVLTVRDLLAWLKTRGPEYEAALEHSDAIRVALDMEHVHHSEKIGTPFEIALFPPMTGG
ncbi:molybdopterin converting factor subunit 1 [Zhengella mangrovi]|uniref:Molybdopterin converting factor subunit 1 n=1 Tax=Zhengella mangrovi TaxID=1982044 RepID=A0A2G1QRQ9_9HYPH|nr:molybdopterin converting factor subunit 1 [Zhengella mangrovi]PHP68227.1 molybdopterin converting factor subunit 1 [Zhengella mangrovi]